MVFTSCCHASTCYVIYKSLEQFTPSTCYCPVSDCKNFRETGVIRTSSDLDYEQQKSYNLVVEAHDNGGRRGVTSVEVEILFFCLIYTLLPN